MNKKLDFCLKETKRCLGSAIARGPDARQLLKFARDYYEDARYYEKRDPETALEAVAYAHGFIDAALLLGLVEIKGYHLAAKEKVKKS
jgi:hypothetical protein